MAGGGPVVAGAVVAPAGPSPVLAVLHPASRHAPSTTDEASTGARGERIRPVCTRAIIAFALKHQITQIVVGSSRHSRWQHLIGGGSKVARIIREAGAVDIDMHVIARAAARD